LKTFPTSFLKQLKTINYFGVDKNLIFIIGGIIKASAQAAISAPINATIGYVMGPAFKEAYGQSLFEYSYPTYIFLNIKGGTYIRGLNMIWDNVFPRKNR